ncbi:MAG: hypothetical protein K0Q90_612 [Paenibacillaceae bacterium]|jgi:chromosome segregation ATPase|nr:hypothetical protein [Paenibacillaceae bacterium]
MSTNDPILLQILQAVQTLGEDMQTVKSDIRDLKGDVQTLKGDVQTLKGDVQTLKGDVQTLKGDVQTLQGDVQTLKGDVQTLQGDVNNLKVGQAELFQLSSAIRNAQEFTNAKLEGLTLDVRRVEGNLVRVEKKLEEETLDMRGEIRFLNHRIADVELAVDKLKEKRL